VEGSWKWLRNYRVWDANRKIFLYPENWLEPEERPSSRLAIELRDAVKVARQQRASVLLTSAEPSATILAGHALAVALVRDLYRVDLQGVVSKHIGETEKNLDVIFAEAERAGAVLLFDEADALFGKRSEITDAHDRFASAEVTYLLRKIEAFNGLAILATNSKRATVEPLVRRFAFVLDAGGVKPS